MPLYLHHRYQLEAAAHTLGGADYSFALRGDGQVPIEIVSGDRQREALDALLATVEPEFLALPERLLELIPPRAFGMSGGEVFTKATAPTLDPIGMAASAADFTFSFILQPERMTRLVQFHARDSAYPGLDEAVDRLLAATWRAGQENTAYRRAIDEAVERTALDRLMAEAAAAENTPQVRAVLNAKIGELATWLASLDAPTPHQAMALEDIRRWQARDESTSVTSDPARLPPGSPIGGGRR